MGFLDGYKTYDVEKEGFGNPWSWRKAFFTKITSDEAKLILQEDDPFNILDIPKNATMAQIKKAFYKQAMKWHPDRNPDCVDKATAMMKKINAAYSLLT